MRTAHFVNEYGDAVQVRVMKDGRVLYKRAPGAGDHYPVFCPMSQRDLEELDLAKQLKDNILQMRSVLKRLPKP